MDEVTALRREVRYLRIGLIVAGVGAAVWLLVLTVMPPARHIQAETVETRHLRISDGQGRIGATFFWTDDKEYGVGEARLVFIEPRRLSDGKLEDGEALFLMNGGFFHWDYERRFVPAYP